MTCEGVRELGRNVKEVVAFQRPFQMSPPIREEKNIRDENASETSDRVDSTETLGAS
jgi:hypothetical protein